MSADEKLCASAKSERSVPAIFELGTVGSGRPTIAKAGRPSLAAPRNNEGFHMAGNLISETVEAWRSVITLLADRRRSRAATREFWAMGMDECTGILNDIGLSRREFDDAMRLPYASEDLLSSAMRSAGIDPDSFQSLQAHGFMSRTCIACRIAASVMITWPPSISKATIRISVRTARISQTCSRTDSARKRPRNPLE